MQQQVEEVLALYFERVDSGLPVDPHELIRAHPELADELREFFDNLSVLSDLIDQATPSESEAATQAAPRSVPKSIGRYEVQTVLGEGGFGRVFLAYDEQLERHVAIKVPHPHLVTREEQRERFVAEGRNLARLSHPNLLSVFDAGIDEAGQCFTVTEYIEGRSLYQIIAEGGLTVSEALDILVQIVDGLEAAHQAGIIHRDLKPSNILVNDDGRVAIADFGLAVRDEQQWEQRGQLAGTRPYMAPEQLRGENHRLDPRTDIWAVGVVAYELLTGQRPFPGRKAAELLRAIEQDEIASVRAFNRSIPTMLERVCHRCLQERMVDRYPSAAELAIELKQLQARGLPPTSDASQAVFDEVAHQLTPPGVRSFESTDADAYVLLVPGLRDVNGVPELVRSWVDKLDCRVASNTFPIGIVYGPSGSGKSSFVKAGVVPRLRTETHVLTMEATKDDTSDRLRVGLERLVPQAIEGSDWDDLPLSQLLAQLRRWCHARDEKIVLVMDQIEQWFSTWDGDAAHPLVTALRQCDGAALQAVLVVRDDFWLVMSRFMAALEQSVVDGENAQLMDLLEPKHAIDVLRGLGRAYRTLPPHPQPLSPTQSKFLEDAVDELAANRKVAPVQLALLAQMLQHETWDTRLLEKLGGIRGIGVRFFEQTFSSEQTPTFYRDHLPAIQAVLRMLLPLPHADSPAHIKGASCSLQTLRDASGCGSDEATFQELMRILERDTRLVTPVDPLRDEDGECEEPHFQLAHDYLVDSLREWLDRTDALTRRGRTRQLLRRLNETWSTHEDTRHLPGFLEWVQIRSMVPRAEWSWSQARMLRLAQQRILRRAILLACIVAIAGATAWTAVGNLRTQNFLNSWLHRPATELVIGMDQLKQQRGRATRYLQRILNESETNNQPTLARRARIGLAVLIPGYETSLLQQLSEIPVDELPALIKGLSGTSNDQLDLDSLWRKLESNDTTAGEFLTTAVFLAARIPNAEAWESVVPDLAALLHQNPNANDYLELLRPISKHLLPEVAELVATSADGVRIREPVHMYQRVAGLDRDLGPLMRRFAATLDPQGDRPIHEAKQAAAVANALAMLGHWEPMGQVFSSTTNPTMTSHLLQFLNEPNLQIDSLVDQLQVTSDERVVRGFTLAVGTMGKTLPTRSREQLVRAMVEAGIRNPTHGVLHAGSWTLRNLEMDLEQLPVQLKNEWVSRKPSHWRRISFADGTVAEIDELPLSTLQKSRQLESPMVCCPSGEFRRLDDLQRPLKLIAPRPYALGTTEVTVEQYLRFRNDHKWGSRTAPSFDCPINEVTWYDAVAYCQWLNEQCNVPEEHWCYLPNAKGEFAEGMTIPEDALERQGFRLPTVAEWELAARAEAKTTWHFGNDPSVTQEYAWFNANAGFSSHAVGQLKPNALGLFDMHGNVWEWCHDEFEKDHEEGDEEALLPHRRLCGGTHLDPPVDLRFTMTHGNPITKHTDADSFRICRTLPSEFPPEQETLTTSD